MLLQDGKEKVARPVLLVQRPDDFEVIWLFVYEMIMELTVARIFLHSDGAKECQNK